MTDWAEIIDVSEVRAFATTLLKTLEQARTSAKRTGRDVELLDHIRAYLTEPGTWLEAEQVERMAEDPNLFRDMWRSLHAVTVAAFRRWPESEALLRWAQLAPSALRDRMRERLSEWTPQVPQVDIPAMAVREAYRLPNWNPQGLDGNVEALLTGSKRFQLEKV
ncbi:MAG: hypothetical protein K6V73_07710 [Firmicutes bacterium]|nr:hypothetical protein [Bacillota bacterium]